MCSDVLFDVDSDFTVKYNLTLINDQVTDVQRQESAWKQAGEEQD